MMRNRFPRPLALISSLPFIALLASCGLAGQSQPDKSRPDAEPSSTKAAGEPTPSKSDILDLSSVAPPFPEVSDSLDWNRENVEDGASAESDPHADLPKQSDSYMPGNPLEGALPASGDERPEGIRKLPRPKEWPDRVHVLLSRSAGTLSFYSLGKMKIQTETEVETPQGKTQKIVRILVVKGRFLIRRDGAGFSIEESHNKPTVTAARKLRIISLNPYNLVDLNGSVYRGGMHIVGEDNGEVSAINVLGVEDYLRGVLPYELGTVDREALEALKAQAIVARTYAYKRMLRAGSGDFHLYSDVQDQVYKGVRGEYLLSDRAIWETRGMVVTHADTLAICYYFSTCGGRTANKNEVWGGAAISYLVSRPDTDDIGQSYCRASRYSAWTQDWSSAQLTGILRKNLRSAGVADAPSFETLKGIEVTQRAACGRIQCLRLDTDRGPILIRGDKVRWAMRPAATEEKILPSAFFEAKMSGGKVNAVGKAFGHGVGLCQMGSIGRAKANQSFREIIEAYYQGVEIIQYK